MTDRERKGVPEHKSSVLKDLSPRVLLPILGTRRCEYPRLSEESEKESRDEVTLEVWRSCTRNSVEADENCFVLNPAADW